MLNAYVRVWPRCREGS